jgi:hypothetical protein
MEQHVYYVVMVTPVRTQHFTLRFDSNPTVKEVLYELSTQPHTPETLALTVNSMRMLHASGQEHELFNESSTFEYKIEKSWLRIVCPLHVCPITANYEQTKVSN